MKLARPLRFFPKTLLACLMMSSAAIAQDVLEHLRTTSEAEVSMAEAEGKLKRMDLAQKYAAALGNLEKSLATAGELDAIVRLREEQDSVKNTGEPTAHEDKVLVDLRAKYLKSRDEIDAATKTARDQVVQGTGKKLREQEGILTKAGKVDEALNLRKEGEQLLLQLSGGSAAVTPPLADDPRAGAVNPLPVMDIPEENPPVLENPFAIKGDWLESMTIPVTKQKIREPIYVGDRNKNIWVNVVISPQSVWSGSERGKFELHYANVFASKSRFENLEMSGDDRCHFYLKNCALISCDFPKIGWWRGQMKHYFENCYLKGTRSGLSAVSNNAIRAENCVFEDVVFPTMLFLQNQPADYVNDKWMRIVNSRFVKCKIPLSFVLLTRDCVFENCIITDENKKDDSEITKPIQIDMYVSNLQIRTKVPAAVTLNQKKYSEVKPGAIPTAATLLEMMAK
ncbi:hypothetical protein JIN84_08185 [Luteolibacter yonseiensis]|uniref:Pentapeptide repeat protein n=1 Tax=Luteolibacter yonseiensis TaxID=1144680 RepID=A0A934R5F4_9BACT|nr:hypothetical protein [Luteolibacter yonseiensis]MBK1815590.1 hypothetical protein [Luteolibacter yonseiensis]